MDRRVVITGIGTINPLAKDVDTTWSKLLNGESGIDTIKSFDVSDYRSQVGGEIKDFEITDYHIDKKIKNKMDRSQHIAFASTIEACHNARIPFRHPEEHDVIFPGFEGMKFPVDDPYKFGVLFGVGVGGIMSFEEQFEVLLNKGPRRVTPFLIPKMIVNLAGGWIAQSTGAKGINSTYVTACASGTNALGEAFFAIKSGRSDLIISGGFEAGICRVSYAGFGNMHALSTKRNDDPAKASRPFDKDRDGFVMGEGGATIILEEYEHAKKRGANIIAEFVGYGLTADAHHMTSPDPNGEGAVKAINDALDIAGIKPEDIDYINAHGTSTGANDRMETGAIKKAFGDHAKKLCVSSTKSMTGHLLGGAGAFEGMVIAKAVQDDKVPPTINLDNPEEGFDLDYVAHKMQERDVKYAMSNSFGFGGHNAVIIMKKFEE